MARRTKKNTLKMYWSKKEKDIMFGYPDGSQTKSDGHLLHIRFDLETYSYDGTLNNSLVKELENRGYDITTLTFSICKKEDHERWKS